MSLETWKAEFYPIPAWRSNQETDLKVSIAHSLKKWTGLRPENLARHKVRISGRRSWQAVIPAGDPDIQQGELEGRKRPGSLLIDASSCSLCLRFFSCTPCPLYHELGGNLCDEDAPHFKGPYMSWVLDTNPEPMIQALTRTLEREEMKIVKP